MNPVALPPGRARVSTQIPDLGAAPGFDGGTRRGRLCEWRNAHVAHQQARQQREQIWRDRMWADAMVAQRDPMAPLQ
jgi:hypothetical protein